MGPTGGGRRESTGNERAGWRPLGVLILGYVGICLCRQNLPVVIAILHNEFRFDETTVGWVATVGIAAYALGKFVSGFIVDRIGGRQGFLVSILLVAVCAVLSAVGPFGTFTFLIIPWLAVFYGLNRLAGSASWGAMLRIVSSSFGPRRRGWAVAVLSLSYVGGDALARLVAAGIVAVAGAPRDALRWVVGLPALALAGIYLICRSAVPEGPVTISSGRRAPPGEKASFWRSLRSLLRRRAFLVTCALSFSLSLTRDFFRVWDVSLLDHEQPDPLLWPAVLKSAFVSLAAIPTILATGWVWDRMNPTRRLRLFTGNLVLLAVALGTLPLVMTRSAWVTPLLAVVILLLYGPYSLLAGALVFDYSDGETRAAAAGIVDGIGYLGGALAGAAIGSIIHQKGYEVTFGILAFLTLFAAGISLGLTPGPEPIVVRLDDNPRRLRSLPLAALPEADSALRDVGRLDAILTLAGISLSCWERALAPDRIQSFTEALGATPQAPISGAPRGIRAVKLGFPRLALRFDEHPALIVVEGPDLEAGAAVALAAAVDREAYQVIVLDLTDAQHARDLLVDRFQRLVVVTPDRLRDLLLSERPASVFEATVVEQLPLRHLSPYQTSGALKEPTLFYGREAELHAIAGGSLRNFIVVGSRQMGKSSLLVALERRMKQREGVEVTRVVLSDGDPTPQLARRGGREVPVVGDPGEVFRTVAAGTMQRPRLWLIDEADFLVEADAKQHGAISRVMRALSENGYAYFVLAGNWKLYGISSLDQDSPLRNFAEILLLDPLDPIAARNMATKPLLALDLRWDDPSTVDYLIEGTGGRANLIALACGGLIESLGPADRELTRRALDVEVRRGYPGALSVQLCSSVEGHDLLDRLLWTQSLLLGEPAPEETRLALARAGVDASRAEVDRAFHRLTLNYLLIEERGRLRCPVPFLREAIDREGRRLEDLLRADLVAWAAGVRSPKLA